MGRTNHPPFSRAGRRICADLQVRETIEEERDRHPPERLCSGKSRRDSGGQNSKGGKTRENRDRGWGYAVYTVAGGRAHIFRTAVLLCVPGKYGVWGLMYVAWWWEAGEKGARGAYGSAVVRYSTQCDSIVIGSLLCTHGEVVIRDSVSEVSLLRLLVEVKANRIYDIIFLTLS